MVILLLLLGGLDLLNTKENSFVVWSTATLKWADTAILTKIWNQKKVPVTLRMILIFIIALFFFLLTLFSALIGFFVSLVSLVAGNTNEWWVGNTTNLQHMLEKPGDKDESLFSQLLKRVKKKKKE